jgi:crossover junction endodeoxyribonuclease RuvC
LRRDVDGIEAENAPKGVCDGVNARAGCKEEAADKYLHKKAHVPWKPFQVINNRHCGKEDDRGDESIVLQCEIAEGDGEDEQKDCDRNDARGVGEWSPGKAVLLRLIEEVPSRKEDPCGLVESIGNGKGGEGEGEVHRVYYTCVIILGIDPGLATVGIGVLQVRHAEEARPRPSRRPRAAQAPRDDVAGEPALSGVEGSRSMRVIDWCTIETSKGLTLPQRLLEISDDLAQIVRKYMPDLAVIEKLYFETNRKTAMDVAQARGVILLTIEEAGIPILEPTPLELKSAVTGDGRADKKQMQTMLERILDEKCPSDDAADALGLAVFGALQSSGIVRA